MSRLSLSSETTPLLGVSPRSREDIFTALWRDPGQFGFARSEDEAKMLIKRIQEDLDGLRLDHPMWGGLMERVSEDQYSHPMHFLFELLQNADDAEYGSRPPTVNIRYRRGYLLFESNEIGFSDANVISICSATLSTKAKTDPSSEYIGEKGIGFKSVFMIASSIWINSRFYSFRFDEHGKIPRVRPHWDHFPDDSSCRATTGFTAILMKLKGDVNKDELVGNLDKLEPTLLMFLHKVKRVHIDVVRNGGILAFNARSNWQTVLEAENIPTIPKVLHPTTVHRNAVPQSHLAYRHHISNVPRHRKRPDRTSAEMVLVFPRSIPAGQKPRTQRVFAFLPIKDYGFRFAIQSDFLLIASREGVPRNEWNKTLLDNIHHALLGAITQINSGDYDLRYKWPLLLPIEEFLDEVLQYQPEHTFQILAQHRVLEDVEGRQCRPIELAFIPDRFRDDDGVPLLPPKSSKQRMISEKYPKETEEYLKRLGVQELSDENFLTDLKTFISRMPLEFKQKPSSWHSKVCNILFDLVNIFRSTIEGLDLVPLKHNDRWVSPKSGLAYFPGDLDGLEFPRSIKDMGEVRHDVKQNQGQLRLFTELGVPEASKKQFCDKIVKWHGDVMFGQYFKTASDLLSHLVFLYCAGWKSAENKVPDLWCATHVGTPLQISHIYMPSKKRYAASFMAAECNMPFPFLHPKYLEEFSKMDGGLRWLEKTLGIPKTVRIATKSATGGYEPHGDLESLIGERPMEVLAMLKHHWAIYSTLFEPPSPSPHRPLDHSATRMRDRIARMKISCRHGTNKIQLRYTFLPRQDLHELFDLSSFEPCDHPARSCRSCSFIISLMERRSGRASQGSLTPDSLLDVPDPDDPRWDFLEIFGVTIKPGCGLFISRLRQMQGTNIEHKEAISLYKQLQIYGDTLGEDTLIFMKNTPTIYVPVKPNANTGTWHKPSSCVWDGPKCLERVPRLRKFYENQFSLFHITLGIPDADMHTLQAEAKMLLSTDSETRIKSVVESISQYLGEGRGVSSITIMELSTLPMFPITPAGNGSRAVRLASSSEVDVWLIPDDPYLRMAFEGRVNLSVFKVSFFYRIPTLYEALRLRNRVLMIRNIPQSIEPVGRRLHGPYTKSLREKTSYIADLVPHDRRKPLIRAKVFQVEQIRTTWILEVGDRKIRSREEQVRVAVGPDDKDERLLIFIADTDDMLQSLHVPIELKNELARVCSIRPGSEEDTCLTMILAGTNKEFYKRIKEDYDRRIGRGDPITYDEAPPEHTGEPNDIDTISNDDESVPAKELNNLVQGVSANHNTKEQRETTPLAHEPAAEILTEVNASSVPNSNIGTEIPRDDSNLPPERGPLEARDRGQIELGGNGPSGGIKDAADCDTVQKTTAHSTHESAHSENISGGPEIADADGQAPSELASQSTEHRSTNLEGKPQRITEMDVSITAIKAQEENDESRTEGDDTASKRGAVKAEFDAAVVGKLQESDLDDVENTKGVIDSTLQEVDSLTGSRESRSRPASLEPRQLNSGSRSRPPHSSIVVPRGDRGVDPLPLKPSLPNSDDFINMSSGTMMFETRPMTMFIGEDTQDTKYFGELYVSRFLDSFLGPGIFKPNEHWTSPLRTYNGHEPFTSASEDSTFTISDRGGKLREAVIRATGIDGALLEKTCTFHIQVCATNGDAYSPFNLTNPQYKKAHEASICKGKTVKQVYILARIYRVLEDPGIAFYADPWTLQQEGLIALEPESSYQGIISTAAPAMLTQDWASSSDASQTDEIYRGLDVGPGQIRLIKLELNGENEPLKGELVPVSIDSQELDAFWAISYVWGARPKAGVSPDFESIGKGKILITDSLAACLKCLRRKRVTARIWADAVCINQKNNVEKAMQVRRMGSLYKRAQHVIIWTGVERKEVDDRAIESLLKQQDPYVKPLAEHISHIEKFLERPWFGRTWTIQELVFGSNVTVMCGDSEIGWDAFIKGVQQCHQLNRASPALTGPVLALNHARQKIQSKRMFGFLELLEMFFYSKSSKKRDKLFALLNMTHDTNEKHEIFNPDYDSSRESILARYAKGFVDAGYELDLLYRAGSDKSAPFCSWIPDLMNQRRNDYYPATISTWDAVGSNGLRGFNAGASAPEASVADQKFLSIRGYVFDSIDSCRPLKLQSGISLEFTSVLEDFHRYLRHLRSYPTLQSTADESWKDELLIKTLIGDAAGPQRMSMSPFVKRSQQEELWNWPRGFEKEVLGIQPDQDGNEYASKDPEALALIYKYWQTVKTFTDQIPRAAACITADSYVGLVPGDARAGDALFIAHGAKVPFVLRKESGTQNYTLVGECYVHGLMYDQGCYRAGQRKASGNERVSLI